MGEEKSSEFEIPLGSKSYFYEWMARKLQVGGRMAIYAFE